MQHRWNTMTLTTGRKRWNDVIHCFPCSTIFYINKEDFFTTTTNYRRCHNKTFYKTPSRLNIRKQPFTWRIFQDWDNFPQQTVNAVNIVALKKLDESLNLTKSTYITRQATFSKLKIWCIKASRHKGKHPYIRTQSSMQVIQTSNTTLHWEDQHSVFLNNKPLILNYHMIYDTLLRKLFYTYTRIKYVIINSFF